VGAGEPAGAQPYSYVLNNPLRYTDPNGHAAGGDRQAGCETVCANAAGDIGRCGRGYTPVENEDGTAHLMRTWIRTPSGKYIEKYVWSNQQSYLNFKDYADGMSGANQNMLTLAAVMGATVIFGCILSACTGVGAGLAVEIPGMVLLIGTYKDNYDSAREEFANIRGVDPQKAAKTGC